MSSAREPSPVLYCGNLDKRVNRKILYELGLQAGSVTSVSSQGKGYGFIEYASTDDCAYALELFQGQVSLFGRLVRFDYGSAQAGSHSRR